MTKTFINSLQSQVQEFHEVFEHPTSNVPKSMELVRAIARSSWGVGEELVEFIHASSSNEQEFKDAFIQLLGGLKNAYTKQLTKEFPVDETDRIIAQSDAIADLLYFAFGNAVEIGVDIQKVVNHVHEANMSKLFDDGDGIKYVKYTPEGKVMKGDNFVAPEPKIKEEIINQIKEAEKLAKKKKKNKVKVDKWKFENETIGDIGEELTFVPGEETFKTNDEWQNNVEPVSSAVEAFKDAGDIDDKLTDLPLEEDLTQLDNYIPEKE